MWRARDCIGMTVLKVISAEQLRDLEAPLIVFKHSEPVAALVP